MLVGTSCSTNVLQYSSVKAIPKETQTSLSGALSCTAKSLKGHHSEIAYALLVRDLKDGTVRPNSNYDGPLADSGGLQLKNRLVTLIPSEDALVMDKYPLIFMDQNKGRIGVDRFGLPESKSRKLYQKSLLGSINKTRKARNLSPAKGLVIIAIDGAFTRIDSTAFGNNGYGLDAGNDGTGASGDLDYGVSLSKKVISLDINLVKPTTNLIAVSESLDLEFSSNTKRFGITASAGEGDLGFSLSKTAIESVHSAQQTLIDAAALWIVKKLYSEAQTSQCMPSNNEDTK